MALFHQQSIQQYLNPWAGASVGEVACCVLPSSLLMSTCAEHGCEGRTASYYSTVSVGRVQTVMTTVVHQYTGGRSDS